MEGVILFVDDQIFDSSTNEYKLLFNLKQSEAITNPILPIDNLYDFEKILKSMSIYSAIILDWEFKLELEEGAEKKETPLDILKDNNLYSSIFIYSQQDIADESIKLLSDKYGEKIKFLKKIRTPDDLESEKNRIIREIKGFKETNKHLIIPFVWGNSINQSTQEIFSELEKADPNWVKEIYRNAQDDGSDPNSEIINVFQNLLNELINQDSTLIEALNTVNQTNQVPVSNKEEATAKLYNRLYYTKLNDQAPFSTGDIFKFSDDEYAILISPECDLSDKKKYSFPFELVRFTKSESEKHKIEKRKYPDIFNNGAISRHILPSFPFEDDNYNQIAWIDFKNCMLIKPISELKEKRTRYKLNSPYIYQLRQRYLSSIGRIGVPKIPDTLRAFNLK